jgi:hypothetical protein
MIVLGISLWAGLPIWFRGYITKKAREMMTPDAVGSVIKTRIQGGIVWL